MSFTVGEVISGAQEESNESSFDWFDRENAYVRWLNDGLSDVCRLSKMNKDLEEFELEEDKREYELTERFIEIDRVMLEDSRVLPVNDSYKYGEDKVASVNYTFRYGENGVPKLILDRDPSGNEDYTLDVLSVTEHERVNDDKDEITLPNGFRSVLVDYLNYRSDYSDHENSRMRISKREWEQSVLETTRRYNRSRAKGGRATDPTANDRANR